MRRWSETEPAVDRSVEVEAPLEQAWHQLADGAVAPVSDGELGPTSRGALHIERLGRNSFRMSAWQPPTRWEWVGGLPEGRIYYDHRFRVSGPGINTIAVVGRLARTHVTLTRGVFARVYGRKLDLAIPRLLEWLRATASRTATGACRW